MNQNTLTAYNKQAKDGPGTLISNWWEERELIDATGTRRTIPNSHKPKLREELFVKPPNEVQALQNPNKQNNTNERTLGQKVNEFPNSENSLYGKGVNKADELRKVGKKESMRDQFFFEKIQRELQDQKEEEIRKANEREFTTTTQVEFCKKDNSQTGNTVGRRVMKTQNGSAVPQGQRDEDLFIDSGILQRQPFLTDEQLKEQYPQGESYLTQQPITFWSEKQNDGCFYMSKQNEENPKLTFNKNNEFLKTYHNYTHVKKQSVCSIFYLM